MASIGRPFDADDATRRYQSGEPFKHLLNDLHVSPARLKTALLARGVSIRSNAETQRGLWRFRNPKLYAAAVALYTGVDGLSMHQIAKRLGVPEATIKRHFVATDVNIRSVSDIASQRWREWNTSKVGRATRRRVLTKLWEGRRRTPNPMSMARRELHALLRYRRMSHVGKWEREIADAIRSRGLQVTAQMPMGPYNVDIAMNSFALAVEVTAAGRRANYDTGLRQRCEYLFGRGWSIAFVAYCRQPAVAIDIDAIADQIVTIANIASRHDSATGKYGVIGRNGKLLATGCPNLDDIPGVERLR